MDIYRKINVYVAKDFGDNISLKELDRKSGKFFDQISDIMNDFTEISFDDDSDSKEWIFDSTWSSNLQKAINNDEKLLKNDRFYETLKNIYKKNNSFVGKIEIYCEKEINDKFHLEKQQQEIEKWDNHLKKDIYKLESKLKTISQFSYDYDISKNSSEIEDEYISKFWLTDEENEKTRKAEAEIEIYLYKKLETNIKGKDFLTAYDTAKALYSPDAPYEFMKEVIKIHGTDEKILTSALKAIKNYDKETLEFIKSLYKDVVKTKEYKEVYQKNLQAKQNQEQSR